MSSDFTLLLPYWLLLLPAPWLWLYWRVLHPAAWPRILPVLTIRYPLLKDLQSIQDAPESISSVKRTVSYADLSMALAMSLLVFALSQPVQQETAASQDSESQAADLILVVDTALSMSLSDYTITEQAVSRLDMAKLLLNDFINAYSGEHLALVILSNPPALWLPFTEDKAVVADAVSRISTLLGSRISDLGATLNLVTEQFTDNKEKIVLLISDGGTQVGSIAPQEAAQQLADKGFSLYVMAMGQTDNTSFSAADSSLIYQPVNLPILQQLADNGGGQLFHVRGVQAFNDALKTIETKHSHSLNNDRQHNPVRVWYPLPLLIAMLLLFYSAIIQQKIEADTDAG